MEGFSFKVIKTDSQSGARLGVMATPHGKIHTPAFVPVATKAALKGLTLKQAEELNVEMLMVNTFHLYLRGLKNVKKAGGLHQFMNWDKPLMTDSGGFQVFSLGFGLEQGVGKISNILEIEEKHLLASRGRNLVKITQDSAEFKSPFDGRSLRLSPEISMKIQETLGADLIFAFDECTSPLASYEYTKKAMERTHAWAVRCLKAVETPRRPIAKSRPVAGSRQPGAITQALFGIIQGGYFEDLRKESAKFINSLPFFGFGIGGSLGRSKKDMHRVLEWTTPLLDEGKPRHLLGIGEVADIFEAVERGVDLFDCVLPTRLARHRTALTAKGKILIARSEFSGSRQPLDKKCQCLTCRNYTLGYLYHLLRSQEISGITLLVMHNLYFIINLMKEIRESIAERRFIRLKQKFLGQRGFH